MFELYHKDTTNVVRNPFFSIISLTSIDKQLFLIYSGRL